VSAGDVVLATFTVMAGLMAAQVGVVFVRASIGRLFSAAKA